MPNKPEREIEKLLRACAQERRDEAGAPLDLHPATRRMLLAEAARRTARTPHRANVLARILTLLRARLAVGTAILAGLVVATWALLPSLDNTKGKVQMAQRDAASPPKLAQSAGLEVAAASGEMNSTGPVAKAPALTSDSARRESQNTAAAMQDRLAPQDFEVGRRAEVADAQARDKTIAPVGFKLAGVVKGEAEGAVVAGEALPSVRAESTVAFRTGSYGAAQDPASVATAAAAAPARQAEKRQMQERSLLEERVRRTELAAAPPAAAAPQSDLKKQVAYSGLSQTSPVPITQAFTQVDSRSQTAPAAGAVNGVAREEILASFKLAHADNQIQVIDSDGSTYAGVLHPATTVAFAVQPTPAAPQKSRGVSLGVVQSAKKQDSAVYADKSAVPQNPAYFFEVEGTNSTFKKRVVFTGNLFLDSNALSAMRSRVASGKGGGSQLQQYGPTPSELQNCRITGQAVISDGRTLQINAVPASP